MIASLVLTGVGLALMAAPGLAGYEPPTANVHHIAGPIVASFGAASAAEVLRPIRRAMVVVGLAVAAAPLFVDHPGPALPIALVAGMAIVALSIIPVDTAKRFGGGWTAVLDRSRLAPDHPPPTDANGGTAMSTERTSPQPVESEPNDGQAVDVRRAIGRPRSTRRPIRLGDVARLQPRRSNGGGARVVVVTGASAGVGRAIAHAFARRGDAVALIARDEAALRDAAGEVEDLGGRALVLPLDVADAEAVEAAAARVEAELGPIDVWVNDAMVSVFSPVHEMRADEYRRVTDVTYLGYVHGTLAALRRMRPRDRGTIIQIGSALAYRAIPLQSAYCAAKHAINGFTESLRVELLHDGSKVQVVQVQLPAVNTPQFDWVRSRLRNRPQPVPPIFQPEVIADGVVWVADHPRRELVIGAPAGMAILIDRLVPGFGDRWLARGGYESQQTDEPDDPNRPDNLHGPVHGLHRMHGRFDDRARTGSGQLWWTRHVGWAGTIGLAAVVGGLAAVALRRD